MDPFQHGKAVDQMYSFSIPHKILSVQGGGVVAMMKIELS